MTKTQKQSLQSSYEELETIIKELESSDVDLEKSIQKYKKGLVLAKEIKGRLKKLENEIEEIGS